MKEADVKKANEILKKIKHYKEELEKVNYMLSVNVTARKTYLHYTTDNQYVEIPDTLYKIFAQILKADILQNLEHWQGKLDEL